MEIEVNEHWRRVVGYEGIYEVSTLGRVRRVKAGPNTSAGRIMKLTPHNGGYVIVNLSNVVARMHLVHRLVCMAFHGECPGPDYEVAHEDGNPKNNRADNLSWKTVAANHADKHRHGTMPVGDAHPRMKFSDADVVRMFEQRAGGAKLTEISAHFQANTVHVQAILTRRVRKSVVVPPELIEAANQTDRRKHRELV